jgi:hypothetical protein
MNEFRLEKYEKIQIEEQLKSHLNISNNHDAVQFQITFIFKGTKTDDKLWQKKATMLS